MTQRKSLLLLAMLMAASTAGIAFAAAPAAPAPAQPPRLDANGDGVIDRQEAAAHPHLGQRFDELDKNKDGKLAREELPRMPHARDGGRRGHGGHHWRGGDSQRGMHGADTNNDGRISKAEYDAAFARMDVNKDGYIDQADRLARAEQRRSEWFSKADTDKDGKLSPAELEAARGKKDGPRGPRPPMPPQAPAAK